MLLTDETNSPSNERDLCTMETTTYYVEGIAEHKQASLPIHKQCGGTLPQKMTISDERSE